MNRKLLIQSLIAGALAMAGGVIGLLLSQFSGEGKPTIDPGRAALITGTIGVIASLLTVSTSLIFHRLTLGRNANPARDEQYKAYATIAGSLLFVFAAYVLAYFTEVGPLSTLSFNSVAIGQGVVATAPMLFILIALELIKHPAVMSFRERQIKFFAEIGFEFTPLRILLMSLGAGIGEEMLFRGAIQGWLANHLPVVAAIIIPSVLFGLLHSANRIYMLLAGSIGLYLGGVFAVTGNILVPIIAHTIYDIIAFIHTDRLVKSWRKSNASLTNSTAFL